MTALKAIIVLPVLLLLSPSPSFANSPRCDEPQVVDEFLNQFICIGFVNCQTVGARTYEELRKLPEDQIRSKLWEFMMTKVPANPNMTDQEKEFLKKSVDALFSRFVSVRTADFVVNRAVPEQY